MWGRSKEKAPVRPKPRLTLIAFLILLVAFGQYFAWNALTNSRLSLSLRHRVNISQVPLIFDGVSLTHGHCLGEAFDALALGQIGSAAGAADSSFMRLPLSTWNHALCALRPEACRGNCAASTWVTWQPGSDCRVPAAAFNRASCAPALKPPAEARWGLQCKPDGAPAGTPELECLLSSSLYDTADADGLILYHVSLTRDSIRKNPLVRDLLLHPPERSARGQVWQFVSMWESTVYYPGGADPLLLAEFDITIGSDRSHLRQFSMSYFPDWDAMLRPVTLAEKLAHPALPRRSNITLVQSNCNSPGGREAFLRELLTLIPVDSFGQCLNNRDPGEFGIEAAGWHNSQDVKHALMHGYKFVLAFENSITYDYFSEKALDAWEAGAVPVYRGAPNVDDYVPGEHSLVRVTDDMTPAALAELLRRLDANDTAYAEYHAWRQQPPEFIRASSPLGRMVRLSKHSRKIQCAACLAAHERRALP